LSYGRKYLLDNDLRVVHFPPRVGLYAFLYAHYNRGRIK